MASREQAAKLPWSKPALYDLTEYIDTGGGPMDKPHSNDPATFEDENRPNFGSNPRRKTYTPGTVPG